MWSLFSHDENGKPANWYKMVDDQYNIDANLDQNLDGTWKLSIGSTTEEGAEMFFDHLETIPDSPEIAEVFARANEAIRKFGERIAKRFSSVQPRPPKSSFRY